MAEPTAGESLPMPALTRCPWCSADLANADVPTCPSCGANLTADGEPQVPGVTAVDIEKIALRRTGPPKKSRLMALITGDMDYEPEAPPAVAPSSVQPPPLEVRREILRLEMEARLADLTAEAGAMASDEAFEAEAEGVRAAADFGAEPGTAATIEEPRPDRAIAPDVDAPPPPAGAAEPGEKPPSDSGNGAAG